MTDINKESIDLLNDLIETSKDGEDGFNTSAKDIKNSAIQQFFLTRAADCGAAVSELQAEVERLGGKPETSSSVSGTLHRAWVDLKAMVTGKDDEAILNEVERGEDVALKAYNEAIEKAIKHNLPVLGLIQNQKAGVQKNHDEVKRLRDLARAAH